MSERKPDYLELALWITTALVLATLLQTCRLDGHADRLDALEAQAQEEKP